MAIDLVSKYRALRVIVEPTQTTLDPQRGPVVVAPPVIVQFRNSIASVEKDVWEKIKGMHVYTGVGGEKMVWRADEPAAPIGHGPGNVIVQSGMAVGHAAPQKKEPLEGWDGMNVKDVKQAIDAGRIRDYAEAIEYESRKGGRKRKTVITALAEAMTDKSAESFVEPPEDYDASALPDQSFSAPAPKAKGD